MKRAVITLFALLLTLGLVASPTSRAQERAVITTAAGASLFTPDELEDLLAPIALYPDPLLAQILPAATFVDQLDHAARFVRLYGAGTDIDTQPWDLSVKAVAHYPEILFMMDRKRDWTIALGQAFVTQEADVMNAIQQLRAEAVREGNLVSTPQQQVIIEGGIIRIVPAEPDVIFVPQYDPYLVYVAPPPATSGFIFFGSGLVIGAWLNRDCNWRSHRIFYHGWNGGGWVGRARPHIRDRKHVYQVPGNRRIRINRRIVQHDLRGYRQEIRRGVQIRRERRVRPPPMKRPEQPHRLQPTRPPAPPRPAPPVRRAPQRTNSRDLYRGRDLHQTQPPSQSGYGGYGSRQDAERYRERGRRSLENMQRFHRPVPARSPGATGAKPVRKPAVRSAPRRSPTRKIQPQEKRR